MENYFKDCDNPLPHWGRRAERKKLPGEQF
jgi:hypothetical protein